MVVSLLLTVSTRMFFFNKRRHTDAVDLSLQRLSLIVSVKTKVIRHDLESGLERSAYCI